MSRSNDPDAAPATDPYQAFLAGRISAAQCAARWVAAIDDPLSECSLPGWSKEALDRLTHVGATWDQFDDFLTIMGNTSASPAPDARSIRGTGSWKPNPDLLVFVDLDGVVSPITLRASDSRFAPLRNDPLIRSDAPPDTGWDDWTNETIDYVPVPQPLLDGLAAMSQRPEIEVAWATTWEEKANWLFEDVGMGTRLPVYLFAWHDDEPVTKWSTVVDQYEQRRLPFVWIDDHLGVDEAGWAQSLDVDSLLIRTNTFHGITRECWAHIEAWIDHQLTQTPGGR